VCFTVNMLYFILGLNPDVHLGKSLDEIYGHMIDMVSICVHFTCDPNDCPSCIYHNCQPLLHICLRQSSAHLIISPNISVSLTSFPYVAAVFFVFCMSLATALSLVLFTRAHLVTSNQIKFISKCKNSAHSKHVMHLGGTARRI